MYSTICSESLHFFNKDGSNNSTCNHYFHSRKKRGTNSCKFNLSWYLDRDKSIHTDCVHWNGDRYKIQNNNKDRNIHYNIREVEDSDSYTSECSRKQRMTCKIRFSTPSRNISSNSKSLNYFHFNSNLGNSVKHVCKRTKKHEYITHTCVNGYVYPVKLKVVNLHKLTKRVSSTNTIVWPTSNDIQKRPTLSLLDLWWSSFIVHESLIPKNIGNTFNALSFFKLNQIVL